MVMKNKQISSSSKEFAKGGNGHMVGKQHAGTQKPGVTSTEHGAGGQWAKGGSGHMVGPQSAKPAKSC